MLECHEHFVYQVSSRYTGGEQWKMQVIWCVLGFGIYLFLTDRLSLVDAICPFFTLGDIGSIDGVFLDQFMEQVDGLILGFSNSTFGNCQVVNSSNGGKHSCEIEN